MHSAWKLSRNLPVGRSDGQRSLPALLLSFLRRIIPNCVLVSIPGKARSSLPFFFIFFFTALELGHCALKGCSMPVQTDRQADRQTGLRVGSNLGSWKTVDICGNQCVIYLFVSPVYMFWRFGVSVCWSAFRLFVLVKFKVKVPAAIPQSPRWPL